MPKIKYKPKPMTKGQYESLQKLIEYCEVDERHHWNVTGKPSEGHIYNDIQRLIDYSFQCQVKETKDA